MEIENTFFAPFGFVADPSLSSSVQNQNRDNSDWLNCPICKSIRYQRIEALTEHLAVEHIEYTPYGCVFETCTARRYSKQKLEEHNSARGHSVVTSYRYDEDETKRSKLLALLSVASKSNCHQMEFDQKPGVVGSLENVRSSEIGSSTQSMSDIAVEILNLKKEGKEHPSGTTSTENSSQLSTQLDNTFDIDEDFADNQKILVHNGDDSESLCLLDRSSLSPTALSESLETKPDKLSRPKITAKPIVARRPAYGKSRCALCNKDLNYHRTTRSHVWSHLAKPIYRCKLCNYERMNPEPYALESVLQHLQQVHAIMLGSKEAVEGQYWSDERPKYHKEIGELIERCFGNRLPFSFTAASTVFGKQNTDRLPASWDRFRQRWLRPTTTTSFDDEQIIPASLHLSKEP